MQGIGFNILHSTTALLEWGLRDAPLVPNEPVPGGKGCGITLTPCLGRQEKTVPPTSFSPPLRAVSSRVRKATDCDPRRG